MSDEPLEPVSPLALPQHKPARARHQPPPKKAATMQTAHKLDESTNITIQLDGKTIARTTVEEALNNKSAEIKDVLAISDDTESRPTMLKRRTQDEMLRALGLLASGQQRPRDDDSPAVLEDAIYEVADLRQIVEKLMQVLSSGYQQGLADIRKMTER